MVKQLFTTLLVASIGVLSASAAPITRAQAKTQAARYLKSFKAEPVGSALSKTNSQEEAFYVFNRGENNGFVIVSGDDLLPAIVGYTDRGNYSEKDIPESLKKLLVTYRKLYENVQVTKKPLGISPSAGAIAPIVKTTWDQMEPYNKYCPMFKDVQEFIDPERSLTGCVATAMAQVMSVYKYPASIKKDIAARSNVEVRDDYGEVIGSFSSEAVTAGSPIDWANMLDSYSGIYNTANADAVAKLMYYAGASVDMEYSNLFSGAYAHDVARALRECFGYDDICRYVACSNYTLAGWDEMLGKELSAGRPVIYAGLSINQGGHAFVCDGRDADGLYHINWGWSGISDGYYSLSVLNPYELDPSFNSQGDGFAGEMQAIIGIRPDDGVADADVPKPVMIMYDYFGSTENMYLGTNGTFTNVKLGGMYVNDGEIGFQNNISLGYYNDSNELVAILPATTSNNVTVEPNKGGNIEFTVSQLELPVGVATKIFGVYNTGTSSEPVWQPCGNWDKYYIFASVSATGDTLAIYNEIPEIDAWLANDQEFYASQFNNFCFKLKNISDIDYCGYIGLYLGKGDVCPDNANHLLYVNLPAGKTCPVNIGVAPIYSQKGGEMKYWLKDMFGYTLCEETIMMNDPKVLELVSIEPINGGKTSIVDVDGEQVVIPRLVSTQSGDIEVDVSVKNVTKESVSGNLVIAENIIAMYGPDGFPVKQNGMVFDIAYPSEGNITLAPQTITKIPVVTNYDNFPASIRQTFFNKFVKPNKDTINIIPCEIMYYSPDSTKSVASVNGSFFYEFMSYWDYEDLVNKVNSAVIDSKSNLAIFSVDGGICIKSGIATTIDIVSLTGAKIETICLEAGERKSIPLADGVYVVGNKKVFVKK